MKEAETNELNLDTQHVKGFEHSKSLYDLLVKYPQEVVPIMDFVVYEYMKSKYPDFPANRRIQVRPYPPPHKFLLTTMQQQHTPFVPFLALLMFFVFCFCC